MTEQKFIINVENLHVQMGQQMILQDISLQVTEGEILGIIGPNGCGKTTLLNALSGFVPVDTGTISINNKDVTNVAPHKRAIMGLGRSFQHVGIFKELTVEENLMLGIELAQKYPWWWMFSPKFRKKMDHLVEEALAEVDLVSHRKSTAGVLSGGQLRLLELARLKLFKGNILLIDEPTAGVAPALKEQLAAMIRRLTKEHGFTILVVEHDLKFLFDLVDRVVVLVDGEKYLDGDPKEIQHDERLKKVYFGSS